MSRMIDDEETLKDNGLIEIDGCNVAECSLYCNGNCLRYMAEKNSIENVKCNSYCDYGALARQEQLQRAKAENETLHITIEKLKGDLYIAEDSLRDYQEHYNKLDAENEKLKAEVKEIRTWEELKLSKYRKALEEVREWLLKWRFNANIIKHTNEPLNKINEVLNERI